MGSEAESNRNKFDAIINASYPMDEQVRLTIEASMTDDEIAGQHALEAQFIASQHRSEARRRGKQRSDLGRSGLRGFFREIGFSL